MNNVISNGRAIQGSYSSLLVSGFEDAVIQSQSVFRIALMAMSEPGTAHTIPQPPVLRGLHPATYALCLTLFDNTTPVWVSPSLDTPVLRANLAFHCASPLVSERKDAHFALLSDADLQDVSGFDRGSDRDPDLSCTIIAQLPALDNGLTSVWRGPGIQNQRKVVLPVDESILLARQACSAFPRGLDFFFTAGDSLLGLPRSTRVLYPIEETLTCM
jgi:alpha-D-ribose 1-methylphosphonate 5-triphosphate synthase subunit PhnH